MRIERKNVSEKRERFTLVGRNLPTHVLMDILAVLESSKAPDGGYWLDRIVEWDDPTENDLWTFPVSVEWDPLEGLPRDEDEDDVFVELAGQGTVDEEGTMELTLNLPFGRETLRQHPRPRGLTIRFE